MAYVAELVQSTEYKIVEATGLENGNQDLANTCCNVAATTYMARNTHPGVQLLLDVVSDPNVCPRNSYSPRPRLKSDGEFKDGKYGWLAAVAAIEHFAPAWKTTQSGALVKDIEVLQDVLTHFNVATETKVHCRVPVLNPAKGRWLRQP